MNPSRPKDARSSDHRLPRRVSREGPRAGTAMPGGAGRAMGAAAATSVFTAIVLLLGLAAELFAPRSAAAQSRPTTVQPGAPGEPARILGDEALPGSDVPGYTEADVRFVRRMILHHEQALRMARLSSGRTESADLLRLVARIQISQEDEIAQLEAWLRERGEAGEAGKGHGAPSDDRATERVAPRARTDDRPRERVDAADTTPRTARMPGMPTSAQMARLEASRGAGFDRFFLELMIRHHEGALVMVEELYRSPGAAQISSIHHFASEIQADQQMEIERMRAMLRGMSEER